MTRAPKPPRVVWVELAADGDFSCAWKTRAEGLRTLPHRWTLHRYVLADAPTPKRKRGKR